MANTSATKPVRKRMKVESNYAEPWKPKAGDVLEGVYMGFDMIPGDRGEKFRSYRIHIEGQDKPAGVAGAFLDSILPRVPEGTHIWITYNGMKDSKGGKAHSYDVECEEGTKLLNIPAASTMNENF